MKYVLRLTTLTDSKVFPQPFPYAVKAYRGGERGLPLNTALWVHCLEVFVSGFFPFFFFPTGKEF